MEGKFFVEYNDGSNGMYYKKSGRCYVVHTALNKKLGVMVHSPAQRITNAAYENAKKIGKIYPEV